MYITGNGWDLQSILRTHCTLSLKFGGSLLLGSGTTAGQWSISDESMIGQVDLLSKDELLFAFSGSLMIPLPQAHFFYHCGCFEH